VPTRLRAFPCTGDGSDSLAKHEADETRAHPRGHGCIRVRSFTAMGAIAGT